MTTTPTASPGLPDLDKLEALARAATPGRWMRLFGERTVYDRMEDGCRGNAIVRADLGYGLQDISNLDFIAGANPAAVLALIALARRAQPEGEAPQAEPPRMSTEESREYLIKFMEKNFTDKTYHRYIRGEHPYPIAGDFAWQMARALRMLERAPAATLSPLCGAQHAESGKEDSASAAREREKRALAEREVSDGLRKELAALAAQQAAAPRSLDADEMTRLRRLMAALGHSDAFGLTDEYVRGVLCTVLGQAAGKLERAALAAAPSAPGTPEAPDTLRINMLGNEIVDTIYMDDGRIIDIGGKHAGNLRAALDKFAAQLNGGQEGSAT